MNRNTWALAGLCLFLGACAAEPGSEAWCEAKEEQSKSDWSMDDAKTYAKHCIIDNLTIGSEQWCEALAEKPKGGWTADEAASYTKHCVI